LVKGQKSKVKGFAVVLLVASLGKSASRLESLELRVFRYGFIWDF